MAVYKHTDDDGDLSIFTSYGEVLIACTHGHYWLLQLQEKKREVLAFDSSVETAKLDVKGEVGGGGQSGTDAPNLFDQALYMDESPEIRRARLETVANRFGPQCREALGLEGD
jgi:hypothetical protein